LRVRFWPLGVVAILTAALIWFSPSKAGEPRALVLESAPAKFATNDPDETRVGQLIWRGTIKLTSKDPDFGGLSGLVVSEDGKRFLAITDAAHWATGTFDFSNGRLTGARGERIVPMLDANGQVMSGKQGDAEGLDTVLPHDIDGPVYVSFEGQHRLWRYAPFEGGQRRVTAEIPLPPAAQQLPSNGGIEALAALSPDAVLGIAEYEATAEGVLPGWMMPVAGTSPAMDIAVLPKPPYAVTDIKLGPDQMLYTVERNFSRETGVAIRLRRASSAEAISGKRIAGEELALMGMSFVIDNFEGIAVRRTPEGKTLIYLAADDNFNAPVQQTLIMMFEVAGE
jgi:hypothetical protein